MSSHAMDSNMNFRMSSQDKSFLISVARLKGLKPNTYMRQVLLGAAERDLAELHLSNKMILEEKEWDHFMKILKAPSKENKNIKRAISSYKKMFE